MEYALTANQLNDECGGKANHCQTTVPVFCAFSEAELESIAIFVFHDSPSVKLSFVNLYVK